MRCYISHKGGGKAEAYLESWLTSYNGGGDWATVATAKLMILPDGGCLIDVIEVPMQWRRRGFGTELVFELRKRFKTVQAIGIRPEAVAFWDTLGMTDALGDERDE